jgi:hypothetical protein
MLSCECKSHGDNMIHRGGRCGKIPAYQWVDYDGRLSWAVCRECAFEWIKPIEGNNHWKEGNIPKELMYDDIF